MIYLVLISVVWAFSFPLIKGGLVALDPTFVAFARMVLSLLVFLPFWKPRVVGRPVALRLGLTGAVQFGLMYMAYITAFQFLPAHTIALLTTTTPLFVTLFHDLRARRFNGLFFGAAAMAFLGGAVVKYPDQPLAANLQGILLVQLSNIAFAFGQLDYKRLAAATRGWNDREVFGFLYLGAVGVTALAAAFTTPWSSLRVTGSQGLILLYLGVVASGVGFFLWNKGARLVNEGTLAVLNNVKIPLGILASLILLGERTDYVRLLIGLTLMGGAALLCERRGR
ncbi:MAG TPA: EamA family transporter [Verrucomicrobiota bacterium]|nr:EamA family transporter [Verrucomicrobiota bacterium]HNU52160.1 EamA family transporter [Verrucomicrobiota bacterium]